MFSPIQLHRSVMGQTCEYGMCDPHGPGAQNLPATVALNVTPANGYTNHYICDGHLVALIETIFDDPEYGPIARKIAKEKIAEYAEADALAEEKELEVLKSAMEEVSEIAPKVMYPCSKCGKPLMNPSARKIHEKFCKGTLTDEDVVHVETKDLQTPADFKEAYGDKGTEGCGY